MRGKQPSPSLSLRKTVAFSGIACVLSLLALELLARIVFAAPDVDLHREHEDIITVLGLPDLNETMEFDPDLFWRLKPELREFKVSGSIRDKAIDFHVSTHDGLRSARRLAPKTGLRILALGDSTTFGLGVEDRKTWPAMLQKQLRATGMDVDVVNAGVPGYTAFQGQRFMQERGFALQPDLVIVTFGFNDADSWGSRSDSETARVLELRRWERPLKHSRLYGGIRKLLHRRAAVGAAAIEPAATPAGGSEDEGKSPASPRLTPQEFYLKMQDLVGDIRARGSEVVFVIWPYRNQIRFRTTEPWKYQKITHMLGKVEGVAVVNLVESFIRADAPLFVDHVHANAAGCRVVAEALAPRVTESLR